MDREKLYKHLEQRYSSKRDMISRIPLGVQPDSLWQELLNFRRSKSTVLPLYSCNGTPYWYVTTDKMISASEKVVNTLFENDTDRDLYSEPPPVSTLEEVFFTGYVEGAQISMQAAMDFLTSDKPPRDIEEQLIVNNRMAGSYATDNLFRPIDANYLRELVSILTDGMDNGGQEYRFSEDTDYYSSDGEVFRFPAPGTIPNLVNTLCIFLGDQKVHPLIKSAVSQAYLIIIRPFNEGNERLGRLLSNILLLRSGYTFFSEISLSALIARRSYAYYEATANILRDENGGDLTYFVEYYLELLSRAVDERRLRLQQANDVFREAETEMARIPLSQPSSTGPPASVVSKERSPSDGETTNDSVTDHLVEGGDIPEGFFTVDTEEPYISDQQDPEYEIRLARVRNELYDILNGGSIIMKKCAEVLLDIMDNGGENFTVEDLRIGCKVTMKQAGNLITHLRQKELIESCNTRQEKGLMIYRFGMGFPPLLPEDYSPEVIEAINMLRSSKRSEKDRRVGELIFTCLPKGLILSSDYTQFNIIERIHYDMSLPIQMGLVERVSRGAYRINRKATINNVKLSDKNKETLTNLYSTYNNEWFTRKDAMVVIGLERSAVYNILHQFTVQGLLECEKKDTNQYRLLVTPESNPSFFIVGKENASGDTTPNKRENHSDRNITLPETKQYENRVYDKEVYELIETLAASGTSRKDQRLAESMKRCIGKGTLLRSDYDKWGYTDNMWQADTTLAKQLGLISKESADYYTMNTHLNPELLPNQKRTITAIYEAFGYDIFSPEMFIATLDYSVSYTYASLHKLTLLRILDQNIGDEGSHYRLLISPEEHPECFDTAA